MIKLIDTAKHLQKLIDSQSERDDVIMQNALECIARIDNKINESEI